MQRTIIVIVCVSLATVRTLFGGSICHAADWPQWRHDVTRSGATHEELPGSMKLLWRLTLGKPAPAFEHQYRMCADYSYAPVAAQGLLFVPSNVTDQVMAIDLDTGELSWRYVTEGPVRFAPVYDSGNVYFTSDDGYLYCVGATDGTLRWRRRGVPDETPDMLMLVNGRMVSRWPARGAPILHNGVVYFGAGIWPEEGVYQNAVNAETGELLWRSDALSLVKEGMCDHGTNHDLSLPPHGYPAVIHNKLAVTSGRTLAAWFDLKTGRMDPYTSFYVKFMPPRGTWYVAGNDDFWVQGGNWFAAHPQAVPPKPADMNQTVPPLIWSRKEPRAAEFSLKARPFLYSDRPMGFTTNAGYENLYSEPIFTSETAYASVYDDAGKYMLPRGHTFVAFRPFDKIVARDLTKPRWRRGKPGVDSGKRATAPIASIEFPIKWEMHTPLRVLIKAGRRLIAGEQGRIVAIEVPEAGAAPRITWQAKIDGHPVHALAANGKLIVVTDGGTVFCFGAGPQSQPSIPVAKTVTRSPTNGFACLFGWGDGQTARELAADPAWRVVVLEKSRDQIEAARDMLNQRGLYGRRAQVIRARQGLELTPYWANLVIVNDPKTLGTPRQTLAAAVDVLRPITGQMRVDGPVDRSMVETLIAGGTGYRFEGSTLRRIAAPAGAADWSHETADADNSFISKDHAVKWPLGVLWYSGDIDRFYTPEAQYQHERNPYPLVKNGRMFIIAHDVVHAIDIYTGNYLWKATMPQTPYVRTRWFDNRLYGRPTDRNYVAADDWLYCVAGETINAFDAKTGQPQQTFSIPKPLKSEVIASIGQPTEQRHPETGESLVIQPVPAWTEVRLWNHLLLARLGRRLVAIDRHDGAIRWTRKSTREYTTYAIGRDTLYGLDCTPDSYRKPPRQQDKRGELFALDPSNGKLLWSKEVSYRSWPPIQTPGARLWMKPPMPFLGYNAKHKLLVLAYNGNNIIVFRAQDGAQLWKMENPGMDKDPRIYSPNILDDYLVLSLSKYTGGMGFFVDIRTGQRLHDENEIPRARTCGRLLGNNHVLTYRDAATELYDVDRGRTVPFNSMRAGCTTSFIPAGGVLAGPMLGHGCVCNYPMFASVALYHLPDIDPVRPKDVRQSWGADQVQAAGK